MKIINQKGNTLIEVMVAMFILTMGIVAVLDWGVATIRMSGTMKDRIVALNLAREGLEIMHSIRDTNLVANKTGNCWDRGNYCGLTEVREFWNVDKNTTDLAGAESCAEISSCNLEEVLDSGSFSYYKASNTDIDRKFKRAVDIKPIRESDSSVNSVKITSQVQWMWNGIAQNISLSEVLTNWR